MSRMLVRGPIDDSELEADSVPRGVVSLSAVVKN